MNNSGNPGNSGNPEPTEPCEDGFEKKDGECVPINEPVEPEPEPEPSEPCEDGYEQQNGECVPVNHSSSLIPKFWEAAPKNGCEVMVNVNGKSCEDNDVMCPNSLEQIQQAINGAQAGDSICIRGEAGGGPVGGLYQCTDEPCLNIAGTINGTVDARIKLGAYLGESVIFQGLGSAQTWNAIEEDGKLEDEYGRNQVGITASGDYWDIEGFRMEWFGETWLSVRGDYVRVRNMDFQYSYRFGVTVGAGDAKADNQDVNGVEVSYNRIRNVYHHSGVYINSDHHSKIVYVREPVVKYNLITDNGYKSTGEKVPSVNGDPAGGGNSDGVTVENQCTINNDSNYQYCFDGMVKYNVIINMADDCIDNAGEGFTFMGNVLVRCGPEGTRGIKLFSYESDNRLIANFAFQDNDVMTIGYEMRAEDGLEVINNTSVFSKEYGFDGLGQSFTSANNLAAFSLKDDFKRYDPKDSSDWDGSELDPKLESACSKSLDYQYKPLMDNNALNPLTRLYEMYKQFALACRPAEDSPLIDNGRIISGVHCPTADDAPVTPHNASDPTCRHWLGQKPDQGAFERAIWRQE